MKKQTKEEKEIRCENCESVWGCYVPYKGKIDVSLIECPLCMREDE